MAMPAKPTNAQIKRKSTIFSTTTVKKEKEGRTYTSTQIVLRFEKLTK